ncbi:MAG: hypothetical protein J0L55_12430, partial [Caulobacterales bacterium]|nr:hypothetical protein [Caulobacterales bacterium]
MRLATLISYFNARKNLKKTRIQIEELQKKYLKNLPHFALKFPFYKNIQNFDDFPQIDIKTFRANFEELNCENITIIDAQNAAQQSENGQKSALKNDLVAG